MFVTKEQIALVQNTFDKVKPIAPAAAQLFYNRLFEVDPSLRSLFKIDMTEQGAKLMHMIGVAAAGLSHPESIASAVQDLGRRHVAYGVVDAHYQTVGGALLWTLKQGLGADFTPEVETAWAEAYNFLASVMKEAAAKGQSA